MIIRLLLLSVVCLFLSVNAVYGQKSLADAIDYQNQAQSAYNEGNYSKASSLINEAIQIIKANNKGVPENMSSLKGDIDRAIQRQKAEAEDRKNRAEYNEYVERAKGDIDKERYDSASDNLQAALIIYPNGREAKRLLNSIEDIKNAKKAEKKVSEAEAFLTEGNKERALELYEEAKRLDSKSVSVSKIKSITTDIASYNKNIQEAEKLYLEESYEEAIGFIDDASKFMKLKNEHIELKNNSQYKIHLIEGDNFLSSNDYFMAEKKYMSAKEYAMSSSNKSEINERIKEARYSNYLSEAKVQFDANDLEKALTAIEKAESEKSLNPDGQILKEKIYEKMEDRMWQSNDYKRYLNYYPNGKYTSEAKQALTDLNFTKGESMRKSHNYAGALNAFNEAKKYAGYNDAAKIDKKMKQTNRWRSAGGSNYFEFSGDLPFGLAATSMTTYDQYGFNYFLSGSGGEYILPETGMGYTKHAKVSGLAPFGAEARFYAPLRINSVPPIRFFAAFSFSSFTTFNLSKIEAIQDYTLYSEGDTYQPTGEIINSIDTLYTGLYANALRFSQIGAKIGIRPIEYVTIYVPIQKVSLRVQPGAPCLDCTTEEVEIGEFGAGVGLEVNYSTGYFTFSAFWENWNGNFNKSINTNVLFDGSSASSGILSPNAYSRNLGIQAGYRINEELSMNLRFENPVIRGKFRAKGGSLQEVHRFSQQLLRLRLTYKLPL